jgi:hypothetical protein
MTHLLITYLPHHGQDTSQFWFWKAAVHVATLSAKRRCQYPPKSALGIAVRDLF